MSRPKGSYNAKTGRGRRNKGADKSQHFFLTSPTHPSNTTPRRRSPNAGRLRFQTKQCRSGSKVLEVMKTACRDATADISVFSSAVQRCGYHRWWSTFREVLALQESEGIRSDTVHFSSVQRALASCLRREGKFEVIPERAELALQIGQRMFHEVKDMPSTDHDLNICLSSIFRLCTAAGSREAYQWALQVWEWSKSKAFQKDTTTDSTFLLLSEQMGDFESVDNMLRERAEGEAEWTEWTDNCVVLFGGLLNAAADRCDSARADAIWNWFVLVGAQPNMICYSTYAKAQMLSGFLHKAVDIINEMEDKSVGAMNSVVAVCCLQCLVLIFHASPSASNRQRLQNLLKRGQHIMETDGRGTTTPEWKRLRAVAAHLLKDTEQMHLRDVLVEWKCRNVSVMKAWTNFPAGSDYLPDGSKRLDMQHAVEASRIANAVVPGP